MKTIRLWILAVVLGAPELVLAQFGYWSPVNGGNGHYYEAVATSGVNWSTAITMATNKGGYLVTLTSKQENAFVFGLIETNLALWVHRSTGNSWGPWMGAVQPEGSAEPGGGWTWVTGEPFTYTNWNAGEPNNNDGHEARVHYWAQQAAVGDVWNDTNETNSTIRGLVIEYNHHPNSVLIQIALRSPNQVQLSWLSRASVPYTVEWTGQLPASGWNVLTNLTGTGGTNWAFDAISGSRKIYRVLSVP